MTSKIRSKAFVAAAVLAVGAGVGYGAVQAEFYPDRQPFDYNVACDPTDANIYDRCGSLTGPVFNSFINTPAYGDERAFVDARRTDQTQEGSYKNVLDYVNEGSQEVIIRAYVHNNANGSLNESGEGIATGTNVRFALPQGEGNVLRARGYINATNASLVEDTVDFRGSTDFTVEYIPGSAMLYNEGPFKDGVQLSDTIVTTGAPIGYDALDGNLPGCFEYEAIVHIRVKITPVVNKEAELDFDKMVRIKNENGGGQWQEVVTTKPGDTVEWILVGTIGGDEGSYMDEIVVRDQPAPYNDVVPGSMVRVNAFDTVNWDESILFTSGYELSDTYYAGSNFYVLFEATVNGDFEGCEARVRNQAFIRSAQHPQEIKDTADVIIVKENCDDPEVSVTCDSLVAGKYVLAPGESTVFTVSETHENTEITGFTFKVNEEVVQNSASNTYTFTADETGTYFVSATVNYTEGSVSGINCARTIDVETEEEPIYRCDVLEVNKLKFNKDEEVEVAVRVTAENGAEFKLATIEFGDESNEFVTNNIEDGVVRTTHSYDEAGEYTIHAEIEFDVNGETKVVQDADCLATVEVEEEEEEFCDVPGKEHLPKDDPGCLPDIPKTGAGSTIAALIAVAVVGAYAHRVMTLKRQ